jgi:hypothetical protein
MDDGGRDVFFSRVGIGIGVLIVDIDRFGRGVSETLETL